MTKPSFLNDPAFKSLRAGDFDGYRRAAAGREVIDFRGADLRAADLRSIDLTTVLLRDAYLREADLRGCDLRHMDLDGASLFHAKISGAYFPNNLAPEEIQLSVEHGTRLRIRRNGGT
jgi:uncharacterized protein YjbI with pentapeptide repeats